MCKSKAIHSSSEEEDKKKRTTCSNSEGGYAAYSEGATFKSEEHGRVAYQTYYDPTDNPYGWFTRIC